MGSCMSKASRIEKQKKGEIALAEGARGIETAEKRSQQQRSPTESETGEEKHISCSLKGEHLCSKPLPCHSTGVADYKKFATGQYILDCQQHSDHHYACPIGPSPSEYYQQHNPTRFYNWHAESTHNAWKNSYRGRGQGALRLNQERSFHTSSPADTYRVTNRSRGYKYEKQRAAEERKVRVVPKVTPFLGEDEPVYGRIGGKVEKSKDNETADILRAAAQMFENNDL